MCRLHLYSLRAIGVIGLCIAVLAFCTTTSLGEIIDENPISTEISGNSYIIYSGNPAALNRQVVASVDIHNTHPLFRTMIGVSPDGKYVSYVTAGSVTLTNATVYVAATDGSGTRLLANFTNDLWTVAPLWSPDSQKLVLVLREQSDKPETLLGLGILDIATGLLNRIPLAEPLHPDLFLGTPHNTLSWSNNGASIQYMDRLVDPALVRSINLNTGTVETWSDGASTTANLPEQETALACSVPIFNQSSYSDIMCCWGNSIARAGCALTSVTMVAKYFGVDIDPPEMNRRLGNNADPLVWYRVTDRSVTGGALAATRIRQGFSFAKLQQDLGNGHPPIVWLDHSSIPPYSHFVVVTGGTGDNPNNYRINDPADGSTNKTLGTYTSQGWRLLEINTYSGTAACVDTDGGSINSGETKTGSISPSYDTDDWYFDGTEGDNVTVYMEKRNSSLDSFVELYLPNGRLLKSDDDAGGDLNSRLSHTLPTSGRYKIRAKAYGSSTGAYSLRLVSEAAGDSDDGRWLAFDQTLNGTISPTNDRDTYFVNASAGTVISVRMAESNSSVDSYLELYNSAGTRIAVNDDGGGNLDSWLVKELPSTGVYRIVARSYSGISSGRYTITLSRHINQNLALNRPANASSVEGSGLEPYRAFDGNARTRWSSRFNDREWIYVDLGGVKSFDKIVLKWETAYARIYTLWYFDGSSRSWKRIYGTNNGRGGIETISFSPIRAQYIKLSGYQRGTQWGYSLWEFEVYNTTTLLMPLVPLDPDEKQPDDLEALAPLAPNEDGKDTMLVGENEDAQETSPLSSDEDIEDSSPEEPVLRPYVEIISPNPLDVFNLDFTLVRFAGYASGSDADENTFPKYEWRSSIDGAIGDALEFTLERAALTSGEHTIYFRAQNEQGIWSDEASTTLYVEHRYHEYLPIVR